MEDDLRNQFILSLADLLKGSKVETEVIVKALELICHAASFDCGLVYEIGSSEQFCLMEHYPADSSMCCRSFDAQILGAQILEPLNPAPLYCMGRGGKTTSSEIQVLDMFSAESLIWTPIVDDASHMCGVIVLLNAASRISFSESDLEALIVPISMFYRYLGVRMYRKKIRQSQLVLESILDSAGIDIYVNDFYSHEVLYVNKSMAAPYGGRENFRDKKCWEVLFPGQTSPCNFCPQEKLLDEQGMPGKVYVWDYQRPFDGLWFRVFSAAFYWEDGRLAHVVSSADITDNKRNEAMIENLANYDQLTGLPNRRMLLQECERRIDKAAAKEQGYVMFFDIDGFKAINDNYGHDAGDEFLILLGEFFSSIPMLGNSIYRNGGDEFVAIVGGENISKSNIQSLGGFIHKRFTKPWQLKRGNVMCNTSIGVACYPEDGSTADKLLQKADMSMYLAKKDGGGKLCFGHQLDKDKR